MKNKTKYPQRVTKRRVKDLKKVDGVKADGTLKKGYRYLKGGRVLKVKSSKKNKDGFI